MLGSNDPFMFPDANTVAPLYTVRNWSKKLLIINTEHNLLSLQDVALRGGSVENNLGKPHF